MLKIILEMNNYEFFNPLNYLPSSENSISLLPQRLQRKTIKKNSTKVFVFYEHKFFHSNFFSFFKMKIAADFPGF